jgi:hypothetical protein
MSVTVSAHFGPQVSAIVLDADMVIGKVRSSTDARYTRLQLFAVGETNAGLNVGGDGIG